MGTLANDAKRYLIIGAGKQSAAIAHYLLTRADAALVTFFDRSETALKTARKRWKKFPTRTTFVSGNAADVNEMTLLMRGYDAAIGAASYKLNVSLTSAAIAAGTHFCDLGGNNAVVAKQFKLSKAATNAGVGIVPDCGVAPGMASVLVSDGIETLGGPTQVRSIAMYCGGLPQRPVGFLKYALFFSVSGLINEYKERCAVLRRGRRTLLRSMTEVETVRIPGLGALEAAHTSGGASTLISTYQDCPNGIEEIRYKTLRYRGKPGTPGHWEIMNLLRDMGWFKDRLAKIVIDGKVITPRQFLEAWLEQTLPHDVPDVLVMRVAVRGKDERRSVTYDIADRMDEATGLTGMQRTTGYSAAIVAEMLANDSIAGRGTLKQELHVPAAKFITKLRQCGIDVRITET